MTINPFQGWMPWHPDKKERDKAQLLTHYHDGLECYAIGVYETFDKAVHALIAAMDHEFASDEFGITKWLQDKGWTIECVRVHSYKV